MKSRISGLIASYAITAAWALPTWAEQVEGRSTSNVPSDINYLLYTPADYDASDADFPLIVWLHGGDQGGSDIAKLRTGGLPKMIEEGRDFPYLVFSPQNPSEELLYPIERVKAALDEVVTTQRVDESRIYVMGYSRGGFGAWSLAEQFPQVFAAVVPIAGGGVRHYLNRTSEHAAFWIFHGTEDEVIPLSDSVVMAQRLQELGRDVRLTVAESTSHEEIETTALNDADLWKWLAEKSLPDVPSVAGP